MATFYRSLAYSLGVVTLTALCTLAAAYIVKPPGVVASYTHVELAVHQMAAYHPIADLRVAVRESIRDGCRRCGKQANADYLRSNQVGQPWRTSADLNSPPDAIPWRV